MSASPDMRGAYRVELAARVIVHVSDTRPHEPIIVRLRDPSDATVFDESGAGAPIADRRLQATILRARAEVPWGSAHYDARVLEGS